VFQGTFQYANAMREGCEWELSKATVAVRSGVAYFVALKSACGTVCSDSCKARDEKIN
jgi:hypothetical protein